MNPPHFKETYHQSKQVGLPLDPEHNRYKTHHWKRPCGTYSDNLGSIVIVSLYKTTMIAYSILYTTNV